MTPPHDIELLETAAEWFARSRDELDLEAAGELDRWLAQSEAHRRAFDEVSSAWVTLSGLGSTPELIVLRRNALDNASKAVRRRWRRRPGRGWAVGVAAAACALVAVGLGTAYLHDLGVERTYRTATGERRTITLADGSHVSLDATTALSVRYSARRRSLELQAGQAQFEVAKDRNRPFEVAARDRTVIATGTVFNVDLVSSALVVTLLEGTVAVDGSDAPRAGGAAAIAMKAGQQLVVEPGARPQLRSNVDLSGAVAWTAGKLVFDDQPLSQVIERVNRHSPRPVRLADRASTDVRFSGVFNAGDSEAFVAGVTSQLPLRRGETRSGEILLYAARR